jgi:hypothetical protein
MTASTRNQRLIRGFVIGALTIGTLGFTAPLAAAEPISSVHDAVAKAPAARTAPQPAPRPAPQPKPAEENTAQPDAENSG